MNAEKTIGVGMSGGVDSSMAAWLLKEQGLDVRGYTMNFCPHGLSEAAEKGADAARIIGIPHTVLTAENPFENLVVEPFIQDYANGRTPSPCVLCNERMKFGWMAERILAEGCDAVATGHYANIDFNEESGRYELSRGLDPAKDQSYFLARLSQQQLSRAVFPLGKLLKTDIKAKADELGLVLKEQKESQDLCFIPDGRFADFVAERRPDLEQPGWIVDSQGKRLGRHQGAFRYTRGQRRGLGLGGGPWFVLDHLMHENRVIVGREEELLCRDVRVKQLVSGQRELKPGMAVPCQVQVRYRMREVPAILEVQEENQAVIHLADPVAAVAPGQLAVCYDGFRVLAAGWIQ